jgi:hypothetical protein
MKYRNNIELSLLMILEGFGTLLDGFISLALFPISFTAKRQHRFQTAFHRLSFWASMRSLKIVFGRTGDDL